MWLLSHILIECMNFMRKKKIYMWTKVDGTTKGTILLEQLNFKVFFTPSFTDETGNKREFSSKHETEKVIFNLMFTYSGLRAWNVRLV